MDLGLQTPISSKSRWWLESTAVQTAKTAIHIALAIEGPAALQILTDLQTSAMDELHLSRGRFRAAIWPSHIPG